MTQSPALTAADLAALCARAFPDRPGQTVVEVRPIPSRQHEMVGFELWWMGSDNVLRHEDLLVRRYESTLSWWQPDDHGKAQREITICRWLHGQGFPVPMVYAREFGVPGDVVLFARLPNQELSIGGRPLREAVEPLVGPFARLLARLHSLNPPDEVRRVVPRVTLPIALAGLAAMAYQIGQPDLQAAIQRVMARAYDAPESGPILLHGDYHLLNALLHEQQIIALVDWEYSALGDPRWDIANAYMQLVDFGAAAAADRFLAAYLQHSGRKFEGPSLYNIVVPLQQWAVSERLVQQATTGQYSGFASVQDLIALRDVHRRRAELALQRLADG